MLQELPFDIQSLHAAYKAGVTPESVLDECLRRIEEAADPGIFLCRVDREVVRAEAVKLGAFDPVGKPLWGVPFVIKDNIDAAGLPTTAACPAYAYVAERDAFVVAVLREAGALLIGKTNLDQFATGLVGTRSPYPPPKNALDLAIVPGGSSSGSAVAVALGLVGFSLGTDTAGSGRVPAALNGIVGLKPSLGALSSAGVVPACRTLDTVSIFTLTVEDAYAVFRVTAKWDAADAYARPVCAPPLAPPPPVVRVGVPNAATLEFFGDAAQAASFAATLDRVSELGGVVVEQDFTPLYDVAALLYGGAWLAERHAVAGPLLRTHPESVHPVLRHILAEAEHLTAVDAFNDMYRLQTLKRQAAPLLESVDMLCVPSIPAFCTLADVAADPVGANARLGTYTNFVNLLDLCGVAVPVAPRADGRPGGVTLLAARECDAQLAAFGAALQRVCGGQLGATRWSLPPALPSEADAGPDEIVLAVVGAHMSGLPLNGELTSLGGRFLREARTVERYRLFSLPGGPPVRPGLLRFDTGASIQLELWALPVTRFGEFLRGVPAPLAIGTLVLEDGQQVKGFLCESIATAGADEVTACGGWRAYLNAVSTSPRTN